MASWEPEPRYRMHVYTCVDEDGFPVEPEVRISRFHFLVCVGFIVFCLALAGVLWLLS